MNALQVDFDCTLKLQFHGSKVTSDAERLSVDPTMRHVVGGRAKHKQAASTSQMGRFETDVLTQADNLDALMNLPGRWIDTVRQRPYQSLFRPGSRPDGRQMQRCENRKPH